MGKIIVCGDIHGCWGHLNELINKKNPELILQVGDFGYWEKYGLDIKAKNTKIIFADGNHENHDELDMFEGEFPEVCQNVFHGKRGNVYTLPDGRRVLFMGGAASIDKIYRVEGVDWFPQEVIPLSEAYKLRERGVKDIDIVISHTCPIEFPISDYRFHDPSQEILSLILWEYKPKLWYFGHFHRYREGFHAPTKTKWYCLNMSKETNWWKYLED